jgi:hypothetical protein
MRKATNKELVEELTSINVDGKYDQLIENAKSGRYHDFKNPDDVICGKTELVHDLQKFPELEQYRQDVMNGDYDEEADEDDKEMMREGLPPSMRDILGL